MSFPHFLPSYYILIIRGTGNAEEPPLKAFFAHRLLCCQHQMEDVAMVQANMEPLAVDRITQTSELMFL